VAVVVEDAAAVIGDDVFYGVKRHTVDGGALVADGLPLGVFASNLEVHVVAGRGSRSSLSTMTSMPGRNPSA
jgi:hypothetical protein